MTDESPSDAAPASTDRAEALAERVRDLKVPNQTTVVEQRILWAAIASTAVGVIAIWAGYWGASGTNQLWKQMPYVISGGIFGVALVAAGAVLFARWSLAGLFRYWLARTLGEQEVQTDRLIEAVEGLERAIRTNTAVTARIANPEAKPGAKPSGARLGSRSRAKS
jgi:hypothetical protein